MLVVSTRYSPSPGLRQGFDHAFNRSNVSSKLELPSGPLHFALDSSIGIDLSSTYITGARKYIAFSRISSVIFSGEVLTKKSPSRVDPVEKSFHMHRMPISLRVLGLNRSNVKPAVRYNGRRYSPVLMGWTRLRTLKSYQRQHADESLKSVAYPKGPLAFREVFRNAALEARNICLSGDFGQCRTVAARLEPSTETWTRVVTHVGRRCGVTSVDRGSGALVSLRKEHVEMYRDETRRGRANCIALGNSTGSIALKYFIVRLGSYQKPILKKFPKVKG
ncbi:hypothetical protein V1478_016668 [Vespula squamosa]|uniref:Uncharacterized protein n=1 Tax=Vespula squamosa TaxID=30214 RepID=A0ABD2A121_VESSQ